MGADSSVLGVRLINDFCMSVWTSVLSVYGWCYVDAFVLLWCFACLRECENVFCYFILPSMVVAVAGVLYVWVLMPAYASAQYTPALVLEKPVRR